MVWSFYARSQKSYPSKFQKCCPTKIKKQVKKKFSFPAIEKRLDLTKNTFKEIETALYIFPSRFKTYFNHDW